MRVEAGLEQWNLDYFASIVNRFLLFLEENYIGDKHRAIADFLNEIELFVECFNQDVQDGNKEDITDPTDPASNVGILKMKFTSWRNKVNKLQSINPHVTADIVGDVINLLALAERTYSNVEDTFLVESLASRTDRNSRMLEDAVLSFSNFVQLLITDSVEDDQMDRIIEIVEKLDHRTFTLGMNYLN